MVVVNHFSDELSVIQSTAPKCVFATVLVAIRKCLTKTRKEGCIWVHSLRVQALKVGKARWQKHEAMNCFESESREKPNVLLVGTKLASSFLFS